MMDVMYELPSDEKVKACTITKEVVEGTARPELGYADPLPGRESPDGTPSRKRKKSLETA